MIPARWQLYLILAGAFVVGLLGIRSSLLAQGEARLRARIEAKRAAARDAAQEIENEVDALDRDDLKRRAAVWVRNAKR